MRTERRVLPLSDLGGKRAQQSSLRRPEPACAQVEHDRAVVAERSDLHRGQLFGPVVGVLREDALDRRHRPRRDLAQIEQRDVRPGLDLDLGDDRPDALDQIGERVLGERDQGGPAIGGGVRSGGSFGALEHVFPARQLEVDREGRLIPRARLLGRDRA